MSIKNKLSEDEVDRKIAMLREKNKIIERKHQMQLKEKQFEKASMVSSKHQTKYSKEDRFANAYMDVNPDYVSDRFMQSRHLRNSKRDKDDFRRPHHQQYEYNKDRNQRRYYSNSNDDDVDIDIRNTNRMDKNLNNNRARNLSNSSYQSENYSNNRKNQSYQETSEDPPWQSPKNFLYDSSRDRPGEHRVSRPPKRLQYNQNQFRDFNYNNEVMTGRQRTVHKNWLQQRQKVDENRLRRQKAQDGKWKREWDVEKPEKNKHYGNRKNYNNEYENRKSSNFIIQRPKKSNFKENKEFNSGHGMDSQEEVLKDEFKSLEINETEENLKDETEEKLKDESFDADKAEKEWREQLEESRQTNEPKISKVNIEDNDSETIQTESMSYVPDKQDKFEIEKEEQLIANPNDSKNSDSIDNITGTSKSVDSKTLDSDSSENDRNKVESSDLKKDTNESSDLKKDPNESSDLKKDTNESSDLKKDTNESCDSTNEISNQNEKIPEFEITLNASDNLDTDNCSSEEKIELKLEDDEVVDNKTSNNQENEEGIKNFNREKVEENPSNESLNDSDLVSDEEFYDVTEEQEVPASPDRGEKATEDGEVPTKNENSDVVA